MEDQHRLQEKVDLCLDNRQIFLFFVASAVLISLVFALGVVVGKRLVASGVEQRAPTDPLALLDQIGTNEPVDDQLTFHSALTRDEGAKGKASQPAKPPAPEADKKTAVAQPHPKLKKEAAEPEPPAVAVKAPAKDTAADKADKKATPDKATKTAAASKKSGKRQRKSAETAEGKAYTLQLSSFQDRDEAERFMQKLRDAGLSPHMVPARIPDRGVWYRVRLGSYTSWDDAMAAKVKFESSQQAIAYVARQ